MGNFSSDQDDQNNLVRADLNFIKGSWITTKITSLVYSVCSCFIGGYASMQSNKPILFKSLALLAFVASSGLQV